MIKLEQEKEKYLDLDIAHRQLKQEQECLNKVLDDKKSQIEVLNQRLKDHVEDISNLEEINKRLRAENESLKKDHNELE